MAKDHSACQVTVPLMRSQRTYSPSKVSLPQQSAFY
jgi:hypothetical protein